MYYQTEGYYFFKCNFMKKETFRKIDKEVEARQHFQLTRPPRMEGKVKNAMMNPVKKPKSVKNEMKGK